MPIERKLPPIKIGERRFFRAYIEILRPFTKASNREEDVFAELLYQCYLRRDMQDKRDMFRLVFDYDTKEEIQEYLNISPAVFRNTLSALRKKNLIIKNNQIANHYLINPRDEVNITFRFVINNLEDNG